MKKVLGRICFRIVAVICILLIPQNAEKVMAAATICTTYEGSNVEAQNYSRWADTVKSYLVYDGAQTLMRVQAGGGIDGVLIEYYDTAYNLKGTLILPEELPLFGGFYETENNYFLVTGQNNFSESDEVEVFRVTKYDKSWNRISSTGLCDCNTTVPFDAGSLRMADCGKYLLIRTSHEMYQSPDGLNHQANVTIEVDMEKMQITDSYTAVMNIAYGYVSHSFNQFIEVENNKIVALDHGDAYPRSIVLQKYATDVTSGSFVPDYNSRVSVINVMNFPGETGHNTTGASVGGFAVSEDYYLVAGNSVIQDDSNTTRTTRNIFVASVSKSTDEVTTHWLTGYAEGDGTTSTPQMVKIAENRYVVLWSRNDVVYYTEIDGSGNRRGEIYQVSGTLSDCVPVVAGDKLVWYTWDEETVTFYDINITALGESHVTEIQNGHQYVLNSVSGGYADLVCSVCGEHTQVRVPDSMTVYWNTDGGSTYSTAWDGQQEVNTELFYLCELFPSDADDEIEVLVSDSNLVSVNEYSNYTSGRVKGSLTLKNAGEVAITFRSKYNPDLSKTFTISIGGETEPLKNGVAQGEDGNWYYYVNGVVENSYTGLASNEFGWWYVENGKVNFNYNGLIFCNDAWWCVAGGQVHFDYTGLWSDPYVGWWYVNGGAVDFNASGLVQNEYGWWYVNGGAVDFGYTGLAYDANVGWWYVNGGAINFEACGLVENEYGWWYVNGGAIDFGYSGLAYDVNVGWWYVNGGAIDFGASGLVANEYGWWYVNGGAIDFGYTGLAYDANVGWWYVENGAINFGYNGSCAYDGATYQVVNGAVV